MNPFAPVSDRYWVSPQIALEALATASELGVTALVSNRPDGEEGGQLPAARVAEAASGKGMTFTHLPMTGPPSPEQTDALIALLDGTDGVTLAFCRSGTRSTVIWAFAMVRAGRLSPDDVIVAARNAGYDISHLHPMLSAQRPG